MRVSKTFARAVIALAFVGLTATSASADWDWNRWWHEMHIGYHRNNAWPDPFNEADAMQVMAPFEVMKANGWRLHNTIGHELFKKGDGALLASGFHRVHWIATQAPRSRRVVYVLKGGSDVETIARVNSVKASLAAIASVSGESAKVLVTDIEPVAASGEWATKVKREWLENLAAPRLPAQSASGEPGVAAPSANH